MTILNDSKGNAYVSITPIKVSIVDAGDATRLYVNIGNDNLIDTAKIHYRLTNDIGVGVDPINVYAKGILDMTGADYTNWTGDNQTPFTYIATEFALTIN